MDGMEQAFKFLHVKNQRVKNEQWLAIVVKYTMPSHGVDIIDGIPVILKGTVMYAFQPGVLTATPALGTYDATTKKATWVSTDATEAWVASYKETLASRSRKA
jgi:hypothetical protein